MSIAVAQVTTLLENVLFESPALAAANAAAWLALANSTPADSTLAGLAAAISVSPEASIADQVIGFYAGALGRSPTPSEVQYYVAIAEAGLTAQQIAQGIAAVPPANWNAIANDFTNSAEFKAYYGSGDLVQVLYMNMLGRLPSTSEAAFYHTQLQSGMAVATLAQEFIDSPEYQSQFNGQFPRLLVNTGLLALIGPNLGTIGTLSESVDLSSGAVVLKDGSVFPAASGSDLLTSLGSVASIGGVSNGGTGGNAPVSSKVDLNNSQQILVPIGLNMLNIDVTATGPVTLSIYGVTVPASIGFNVDPYASLAKIVLTGSQPLTVTGLTGLIGVTLDAHAYSGNLTIDSISPVTASFLTIDAGSGANTIAVSGYSDTVNSADAAHGDTISATGVGSNVTLSDTGGINSVTAWGTIKVGSGQDMVTASGSFGSSIEVGASDTGPTVVTSPYTSRLTLDGGNTAPIIATLGVDSTVIFLSPAGSGTETINLLSTGAVSVRSGYTDATFTGATDSQNEILHFATGLGGNDHLTGLINPTGQSSLTGAFNVAAAASSGGAPTVLGDQYFSWFQFGGNTYILDHIGAGAANENWSLSDHAVEITGLVALAHMTLIGSNSHTIAL